MAKKSAVNRNLRVQALVKQYAAKRDALKAIAVDDGGRALLKAAIASAQLPRAMNCTPAL